MFKTILIFILNKKKSIELILRVWKTIAMDIREITAYLYLFVPRFALGKCIIGMLGIYLRQRDQGKRRRY